MKICLVIFSLILCSTLRGGILHGPLTNPSNKHLYYLLTASNWTEAQMEAEKMGGNLATVRNENEQQWIYTNFSFFGNTKRQLWIGFADAQDTGSFTWQSGETPAYRNWAEGEPSFGRERFVHMVLPGHSHSGKWNNINDISTILDNGNLVTFHGVVEIVPVNLTIKVASVQLTWNSVANQVYQLQTTERIEGEWQNVSEPINGISGSVSMIVDVLPADRKFYRIIPVQP